ncbi:MAG: hypothetical protein L0H78_24235 [Humibacillus sp.]|nr:hypothetical protein [Humibacillus sp.]
MLSAVVALCAIAVTSAVLVRTVPRERLRVTIALVLALSTGAAMLVAAEQHQIAVKISIEIPFLGGGGSSSPPTWLRELTPWHPMPADSAACLRPRQAAGRTPALITPVIRAGLGPWPPDRAPWMS